MAQPNLRTTKILPGGLLLVNPLYYEEPFIYRQLVEAWLKLRKLERRDNMEAQFIMKQLANRAGMSSLSEFVNYYAHYNQIEWAYANIEAENNSCKECHLFRPHTFTTRNRWIAVGFDRKFLEDLQERVPILFRPIRGGGQSGATEHWGIVRHIDIAGQSILLENDREDYVNIDEAVTYEAIVQPSSLEFRSRCETLDAIKNLPKWAEHYIFPEKRKALIQHYITEQEYDSRERHFLRHTKFTERRHFNQLQKRAIHGIVSGLHGPCPYILFGPPGTGKTVTLVEAVRILLASSEEGKDQHNNNTASTSTASKQKQQQKETRILVCTPSNTAADNFTLELLEAGAVPSEDLLRIYSMSKKVGTQNAKFVEEDQVLCIVDEGDGQQFGIPEKEELLKKTVIVCTLGTSSYLVHGDLAGCFSHIFIDEAGQADALETLIPIVGLTFPLNNNCIGTRVVLAGDPQQLGPVQTCDSLNRIAKSTSLLELLIGNANMGKRSFDFDKRMTTMLEQNYRSHPALLTVPSRLYYGSKLQSGPLANNNRKDTLCQWANLPKKGFPLLWHGVERSCEDRDEQSGSYCNSAEIDLVADYVETLVATANVYPEEIGIITPYKYQIKQLRLRCQNKYPDIVIDSVERFQGAERRVIIISTVRTDGAGFMADDKRFNTAVTRPKELLIIVGSSRNMRSIKGWAELIHYCEENGALIGEKGQQKIIQKQRQQPMPQPAQQNNWTRRPSVDELASEFGRMGMQDRVSMYQQPARNAGPMNLQNAELLYRE